MKIFGDTEFLENGITIKPISFAFVAENGDEYYAINDDLTLMDKAYTNSWLRKNVLCHLPLLVDEDGDLVWDRDDEHFQYVKPTFQIANEVKWFVNSFTKPEIWYDHGAYDQVVVAQLWGTMMSLPLGFPMWFHELQQELEREPSFVPKEQPDGLHSALADARWIRETYKALEAHRRASTVIGGKALPIPAYPLAHPGRTRIW